MSFFEILVYIILICAVLFIFYKWYSQFKFPKLGALSFFTGGLKVGKTAVSLSCAIHEYKRVLRSVKFSNFWRNLFKKPLLELPILYSNIPLRHISYCPLTLDIINRKKRVANRSVVFIDECSLLADSQLIRDNKVNDNLLLFIKLFGHSSHGGKMIVNSQSLLDVHYSIKRCVSSYFYVHSTSKYIPFLCLAKIREERVGEENIINNYSDDVEVSLKKVLFFKSVFRYYDYCCYSTFTDDLRCENKVLFNEKSTSLKSQQVISFRDKFINGGIDNAEKNDK